VIYFQLFVKYLGISANCRTQILGISPLARVVNKLDEISEIPTVIPNPKVDKKKLNKR